MMTHTKTCKEKSTTSLDKKIGYVCNCNRSFCLTCYAVLVGPYKSECICNLES